MIVLDGEQRSALAVTRSLGRIGVDVFVGAETNPSLAGISRYCRGSFTYPSPTTRSLNFIKCLERIARLYDAFAVFPMTDVTTFEILQNKSRMECVTRIPGVSLEVFERVSDKFCLFREAERIGVAIPKTLFVKDSRKMSNMQSKISFPAVLKPGKSKIREGGRMIEGKVRYADHVEDVLEICNRDEAFRFPFVIQERIEGPGIGVFVLMHRGRTVALFSHRRIREKPPSGGVSVLRESVLPDPVAASAAEKLLCHFGWEGVAMVEFKQDRRDGILRLMEINGRFWGSLQLAVDSGVDFPSLLLKTLQGKKLEPVTAYRLGTKTRWLLGHLDHLLIRLFRKKSELHLPLKYPSRFRCLLQFFNFFDKHTHLEILSSGDRRPFFFELQTYCKELLKKKR